MPRDMLPRARPWLCSAVLGAVLGVWCATFLGGLVLLACSVGLLAWITRRDRQELFAWSLIALGTRWLLVLGITLVLLLTHRYYTLRGDVAFAAFGDDGYYAIRAWWWLQRLLQQPLPYEQLREVTQYISGETYGQSGHVYPIALFYHWFGYSSTAVKGISVLLGVLTGFLVYDLTRAIADRRAARIACGLVWCWPSLVVWSSTNLKDPYALFLFCAALWAFQRWLQAHRWSDMLLAGAAVYAYATIKVHFWLLLALVMAVAWIWHDWSRWVRWSLMVCGVVVFVTVAALLPKDIDTTFKYYMRSIAVLHLGHVSQTEVSGHSERSIYRLLPDKYYNVVRNHEGVRDLTYLEFLRMVLLGVGFFLVVPLPWRLDFGLQWLVAAQVMVWYVLLLAAAIGLWACWRPLMRRAFLPWAALLGFTVLLAIIGGNVGTAFRHRDLVSPLYFIFAAIGIVRAWDAVVT